MYRYFKDVCTYWTNWFNIFLSTSCDFCEHMTRSIMSSNFWQPQLSHYCDWLELLISKERWDSDDYNKLYHKIENVNSITEIVVYENFLSCVDKIYCLERWYSYCKLLVHCFMKCRASAMCFTINCLVNF